MEENLKNLPAFNKSLSSLEHTIRNYVLDSVADLEGAQQAPLPKI